LIIVNVSDLFDNDLVTEYLKQINFNTPEKHVELHNDLFNKYGAQFDIHTRGEMSKDMLNIFSKLGKKIFDIVSSVEYRPYHPSMFSKNYIARYRPGVEKAPSYDESVPNGTYKAFLFWNDLPPESFAMFSAKGITIHPKAGDLVIFKENASNSFGFAKTESLPIYISEFWLSPVGTVPFKNVEYQNVNWEDWEIKGF
jgi:hypothetical protein